MTSAIDNIPFRHIDGEQTTLADYRGKVLLLVNVASKCGLTPQYGALERLFAEKREKGLVVIGFPANDFGGQEPGTNEQIAEFCSMTFNVTFPLAEKVAVRGADQHPLYAALTAAAPKAIDPQEGAMATKLEGYGFNRGKPHDILWNFEKFLIGRDGRVVARFNPDVAPDDPRVVDAIERELAK